jgi:hypothetical protein
MILPRTEAGDVFDDRRLHAPYTKERGQWPIRLEWV